MNQRQHGTTVMELVVASVLLGATLAGITTYRQQTLLSNQVSQRASFAQSRLLNMRREIGTWPIEEITAESIESVAGDESDWLPEAHWVAEVKEIESPIIGKQIKLALQWQEGAKQATSPGLTFWVARP